MTGSQLHNSRNPSEIYDYYQNDVSFKKIQKKYERVCDQYKILENENLRLKSEIDSYLGPKNEPKTEEQEDKWWKENEVYLQKAELESYVKWVKDLNEENDNLKRQIKYIIIPLCI